MIEDGRRAAFICSLLFPMTTHITRSRRRRFALTQEELGELLDLSQTTISRLENGDEPATLETALALQILFDVQPRLLCPSLYGSIEEAVMGRAAALDRRLRHKTDAGSLKKLELLKDLAKRAKPLTPHA